MSTWGDKLGMGAHPVGVGVSTPPLPVQEPQDITYASWQHGLVLSDSPEDIPDSAAQLQVDTRVERDDSLIRMEGVSLNEDVTPRSLRYLFQQASLDYSAELVAIDPPYLGHKLDLGFTFDNVGLADTAGKGWNVCNVAGVLLFSNGSTGTYTRTPGASVVTDISTDVIADTFATCFGRVFAGAFTDPISGYQGLGIRWNGTDSPPETDWSSLNASAELLLSNQQEADRIIANRAIGFDALAILTRKAIWFGYQTGVDNHPAQFRLRYPARGCVAEPTAVTTPHGIIFLGDEGVCIIDLNTSYIISASINDALLPLNYLLLQNYRATYDSIRDRYILVTPTGTWYYEFAKIDQDSGINIPSRWFFSSFVADSVVTFTDQNGNVYWSTVPGVWDDYPDTTWAEMGVGELDAPPVLYFGKGAELGFEDPNGFDYLGVAQTPYWVTKQASPWVTAQISTIWFEVEYATEGTAQVEFATADSRGNFLNTKIITLPDTLGKRRAGVFPFKGTGSGTALQITYKSSTANIFRVKQVFLPTGPVQTSLR